MDSAVAHPSGDAVGQQSGQRTVNRRVSLAQDECQFYRIDEGHLAQDVEQLVGRDGHGSPIRSI